MPDPLFCPVCGEPALAPDATPDDFTCRKCSAAMSVEVFNAAGRWRWVISRGVVKTVGEEGQP